MMLATDLAVLDHADGSVLLVANAVNYDATDERVDERLGRRGRRLDRMTARARRAGAEHRRRPRQSAVPRPTAAQRSAGRTGRRSSGQGGDPGRRGVPDRPLASGSTIDCPARRARRLPGAARHQPQPVHVPAALSPDGGFDVVGSSPEALVKVAAGRAMMHPIAGTRPRGATPEEDARWPRSCSRTPRSAPSTSCSSTSAATTSAGSAQPGTRRGGRLHGGRAVQPRHAHRSHRGRRGAPRAGRRTTCCRHASRPAPCPARPSRARWS